MDMTVCVCQVVTFIVLVLPDQLCVHSMVLYETFLRLVFSQGGVWDISICVVLLFIIPRCNLYLFYLSPGVAVNGSVCKSVAGQGTACEGKCTVCCSSVAILAQDMHNGYLGISLVMGFWGFSAPLPAVRCPRLRAGELSEFRPFR